MQKNSLLFGTRLGRCDTLLVGLCLVILGKLGREKKGGEPVLTRREPSKRAGGYMAVSGKVSQINILKTNTEAVMSFTRFGPFGPIWFL